VTLVYWLVRRRFDAWAALIAALAMSLSPIAVAVDRYNNVDACLVWVLLLAAWILLKATETANRWLLVLGLAMAGVAFNTKMMAAFVVLPVFYALYWLGAKASWGRRLLTLGVASLVLLVVALSWPLAVDLTAPENRPFVGSTQDDSMISLSLGWNGFQRLLRGRRGAFGRGPQVGVPLVPVASTQSGAGASNGSAQAGFAAQSAGGPAGTPNFAPRGNGRQGGRRNGMMGTGEPGIFRLADKNMAGQMSWFLPLALVGLFLAWRRVPLVFPLAPIHQSLLLWSGWFLLYAVVFSFMRGAMHTYYLVMLTPPLAALAGIGLRTLWLEFKAGQRNLLVLTLLLNVLWQAFIVAQFPDWMPFLLPILLVGGTLVVIGLTTLPTDATQLRGGWTRALTAGGLTLLFLCPTVWALTPILGSGTQVEANPDLLTGGDSGMMGRGFGNAVNVKRLVAFLKANHKSEKYLLAAQNSQSVSPIIIQTGEPVIALGGFMGADPVVTVHEFEEMVKEGQVRYFLLQGFGGGNPGVMGNAGAPGIAQGQGFAGGFGGGRGFGNRVGLQADIAKWVRDNGEPVDPKLWRVVDPQEDTTQASFGGGFGGGFRRGVPQLYDLRPETTRRGAGLQVP
jgi:4-amino-4-deoxy-L-arabinose transferase-like glycosyltransferase